MSRCINGVVGTLVATVATASLLIAPGQAQERFTAKLQPLNADKIGRSASGTASFEIEGGNLAIAIDASGAYARLAAYAAFSWISGRQGCRVSDRIGGA